MTHTDNPDPMTVRSPEDLVALVPLVLGFVPEESAVMLTFDERGSSFHARIDLTCSEELDDLVETLLHPCLRHGVRLVFLLCWAGAELTEDLAWRFRDRFTDAGVEVRDVLRVEGGHWYAVLPGRPAHEYEGVPVDLDCHRFTAQSVFSGAVRHASREELRASIDADPELCAGFVAGRAYQPRLLGALVRDAVGRGRALDAEELGRLATSLREGRRRDHVWGHLERADAPRALEWWRATVRRLPDEAAADACAVLAFVAWLAGDGALAWCAVDRCRRSRPDHSLATLVAGMLEEACSPATWDEVAHSLRGGAGPAA